MLVNTVLSSFCKPLSEFKLTYQHVETEVAPERTEEESETSGR